MTMWKFFCLMLKLVLVVGLLYLKVSTADKAPLYTMSPSDRIPGNYIVVLKDDVDVDSFVDAFDGRLGTSVEHSRLRFKNVIKGFSAHLSKKQLNKLRNSKYVELIEEDGVVRASTLSSWGIDRIDQRDLPLDNSAAYQGDGSGTHIYMIDTGTSKTHSDFSGRCSDEGFDVYGIETGQDCNGHGTHCGGTAAGTTYGVASQATVHSVRVLNCEGSGSLSGVLIGMEWVANNAVKPAVASMSLGSGFSICMNHAVQAMHDAGVVVSVAAGNDDKDACGASPASATAAITVAATDISDTRAYFSNFGECIDIFAPGVDITSAWIVSDGASNMISGTSMACPHVSGAAAILLGVDGTLTPTQVANELFQISTVSKVMDLKGSPDRLLFIGGSGPDPDAIPTPEPTPDPDSMTDPNCPSEWLRYEEHCYVYIFTPYRWNLAREHCINLGAELVSIHSVDENSLVEVLSDGGKIWIGLNDMNTEGQFEWSDGTLVNFGQWGRGQPDNRFNQEDCVQFGFFRGEFGQWNDSRCASNRPFICKM